MLGAFWEKVQKPRHADITIVDYMRRITRKQTLRFLSVSSFFWYDNDFSEFDSADIVDYILEKSVSYQKKDGRAQRP